MKAGFRGELEAVKDLQEREALYKKLLVIAYERGKAINMASCLDIDAVIDAADTRRWIIEGLRPASGETTEKIGHDFVDTG